MEFFTSLTAYHWIALALILLTAEMLGAAGFLLGASAAAFGMAALLWVVPDLQVVTQLLIYSVAAIVLTLVYFQLFRDAQAPTRPLLNKRAQRLLGHQFELTEDVHLGQGKVQIGDTLWRVETDSPLSRGTLVEVIDINRMVLVIAAKP
ncbi:MAG: NfeD family protein [Pseudomonadota bacterium]